MARTARTARTAPAPAPVVEETVSEETTNAKRGPSELTNLFVDFLKERYGVDADPEVVYLAQTTRREFRETDAYAKWLEEDDARKDEAAALKAKRAEDRAAAKLAAEQAAPVAEGTEPAKPARRSRAAKAAEPVAADAPAEEAPKPARRSRAAKAAPAPATEAADTTEAPARRSRTKAPF